MNLYVSALNTFITEDDLRALFEKYGKVKSVRIARDEAGHSLCYGFVEMEEKSAGIKALSLNAASLKGSDIRVSIAKAKKKFGKRF
ncbi:MAG: RNA-binding protein [Bacteroidota bacterium]